MASSYTDLGLELMVTGENAGTWGDKTNTNLNIINQAAAGYQAISIAGGANTTTLGIQDGSSDLTGNTNAARNLIIEFTGTITGNQVVTIPDTIEKTYTIINGTTGAFTVEFKTVSGTGFTFAAADKGTRLAYADGTNVVDVNAAFTTISQFTLPTADGTSGQAILTNGSGALSFGEAGIQTGKVIALTTILG
jgi:hypothetical protein